VDLVILEGRSIIVLAMALNSAMYKSRLTALTSLKVCAHRRINGCRLSLIVYFVQKRLLPDLPNSLLNKLSRL
jgi:hypothetical protein